MTCISALIRHTTAVCCCGNIIVQAFCSRLGCSHQFTWWVENLKSCSYSQVATDPPIFCQLYYVRSSLILRPSNVQFLLIYFHAVSNQKLDTQNTGCQAINCICMLLSLRISICACKVCSQKNICSLLRSVLRKKIKLLVTKQTLIQSSQTVDTI